MAEKKCKKRKTTGRIIIEIKKELTDKRRKGR